MKELIASRSISQSKAIEKNRGFGLLPIKFYNKNKALSIAYREPIFFFEYDFILYVQHKKSCNPNQN